VFVAGGFNGLANRTEDSAFVYHWGTGWETLARMPTARAGLACAHYTTQAGGEYVIAAGKLALI
jgi:hypothetical protein